MNPKRPINTRLQSMTGKHLQINKVESTMLVATVMATIITIFSLVCAKTLLAEARFQGHVISARHSVVNQLQANVQAAKTLADQYNQVFENSSPTNVIGGNNDPSPTAVPPNGDNGRIVLDALPTAYDYPALLTSLSKLLAQDGISSPSINGSDQSTTISSQPSSNPQVNTISVTIDGSASYAQVQSLLKDLSRSIRPFDITSLVLNGSESSMTLEMDVTTYYQPAKTLNLNTMEIH